MQRAKPPRRFGQLLSRPVEGTRDVAIVLAAGAGERFARDRPGEHKALAPIAPGVSVAGHCLRVLGRLGCARMLVAGAMPERVVGALAGETDAFTINARWRDGRSGSIVAGLDAMSRAWPMLAVRRLVIWPVDRPCASEADVAALLDAVVTPRDVALPVTWDAHAERERRGHPIACGADIARALRQLSPDQPLRDRLHAPELASVKLVSAGPGVTINVDSVGDLLAAQKWYAQNIASVAGRQSLATGT